MVAHLIRLKLTLLRNSFRRSPWQLVGVALGGLYALGVLALLLGGLFYLSYTEPATARTVVVLGGAAAFLGWALIPLVALGVDMTLDPARFVTFAIPMPQLLAGLAAGGVLGIPGIMTLLASLGQAAAWWQHPAAMLAAVPCAVLAVLTAVVLSRVTTSAGTALASSRRFKDASGVIAMVPLVLLGPIIAGIMEGLRSSQDFLAGLAGVLSWTPLGSVWSVPGDLALGAWGAAAAKLLISLLALAGLVWLWKLSLARALTTPAHTAAAGRSSAGLGLFARFPASPSGAVAARALTYWLKDPRYGASLIVVPLIPVVMFFGTSQAGDFTAMLWLGPLIAFLLAFSISADISYDNTAFALHLAAGVSGRADRAGRALACAVFAVPLTALAVVVPVAAMDRWHLLPALLGLSLGTLLSGLGLSSVVSARYTYNVPLPGESPFKTPPGSAVRTMVVQGLGMGALMLLVLPEGLLTLAMVLTGRPLFGWLALAAGLVLGSALLLAGIRIGGRWYDRRGPELLQAVSVNK
ncbi:transporter [Arthrobacter mobilis]|uniref:Transporter n=1 Tax=Arthrobacter mobilis TaxID=2724944 RepID=A0A7X6K4F4_9MICC|nr:transporter [Arthrobacter mobilis]NKX54580.1 transporter [Arthrobacter mobilis]